MEFSYAELTDDSITGLVDDPDVVRGIGGVAGSIEGNFNPITAGILLRGLFGVSSVGAVGSGYTHSFLPNTGPWSDKCSNPPLGFALNAGESGISSSYLFQDVFINNVEISVAAGNYIRMRANVLGKTGGLMTTPASPVSHAEVKPIAWSAVSLSIGGAGVQRFSDIRFTFNNNIAAQDRIDGTATHTFFFREGFRQFARFSGTIDISQTDYLTFYNGTETSLSMFALGVTSISSGVNEFLKIDIPRLVYTKYPVNVPGPGIITIGIEGRGMYKASSGRVCSIVLQNSKATYA